MLSSEHLCYALQQLAADALPAGLPLAFPGLLLETDALTEWAEVWCEAVGEAVGREAAPGELRVRLTVHLFTRQELRTGRVYELADRLRSGCARRVTPIVAPGSEPPVARGQLRLAEAVVHDLTRVHAERQRPALQHLVVLIDGRAVECD